jgi:hypothetical protein
MTNHKLLSQADLRQFTGSEQWYRHAINRKVLYTDGARYVAVNGGAYWLLDEIALAQFDGRPSAREEFQVWTLGVRADKSATLTCDDGNGRVVHRKELPFTDFPLPTITLYCANNVIYLPSEH